MQINFESEKPIFVQLADWLSDSIISGAIKEGEQIPSTTEMSVNLKINPATALKGVNMLVDKGIIYKKRGLGMFVSQGAVETLKKERQSEFFGEYIRKMLDANLVTPEQIANLLKISVAEVKKIAKKVPVEA